MEKVTLTREQFVLKATEVCARICTSVAIKFNDNSAGIRLSTISGILIRKITDEIFGKEENK